MEFPDLQESWTQELTAEIIADWLEAWAILNNKTLKRGDLSHLIPWETDETNFSKRDVKLESNIWSILKSRQQQLLASWPFHIDSNKMTRREGRHKTYWIIYLYLLFISSKQEVTSEDRRNFEYLCIELIAGWTGSNSYRIGFPALRGEPAGLQDRINIYAKKSHLIHYEVKFPVLPTDKDLGLDGVFWQSFRDRRSGGPHAWLQCATGRDWTTKTMEANNRTIMNHIDPASGVLRLLAIPFCVVVPIANWHRRLQEAGVIFDRTRIAELSKHCDVSSQTYELLDLRIASYGAILAT
ncbi:hypothetical protein QO003_000730 [Arthrobacter silviterrae]|uniref:Uncharacterized protein n=1 Tax=Arthrobacter silviterrae TaxID=2026658 RepID=A0ABX0D679_9MICC|nr:hypothetical protein [Arthrobacter silviterrae]MDQ0276427.1 hypothetical protein [Arthrobacter silviterrae]NGN82394.1 hypothetical protein [Arthrobacter silviterrae]